MMNAFVSLSQVFISIVITVHLMIVCKKKKATQIETNVTPTPIPIPYESNTESCSALSPAKGVTTSATPAPKTASIIGKTPSVKTAPPEEVNKTEDKKTEADNKKVDVREKEKKPEKSLNTAFNERLKEDQSAGVSETV
ncbi:hypothetical protein L5515_004254 [Caenorhabditis briggsae]|uniref:Uncharacterized protein n=2 Tax=Caenorhabditis briggsae TaxID=6238 RepID=A0AAE9EM02_CAEBR|nr:hypothetical protein L5515_004254 [Caenorhabditis briggsae]